MYVYMHDHNSKQTQWVCRFRNWCDTMQRTLEKHTQAIIYRLLKLIHIASGQLCLKGEAGVFTQTFRFELLGEDRA